MRYRMPFNDVAIGTAADTFTTICALLLADTAGYRLKLRAVEIFPSEDPQDRNIAWQIKRVLDVSTGSSGTAGATISTANMPKNDPESIDSFASGGTAYSAEPSTYETNPILSGEFNDRGGCIKEYSFEDAKEIKRDMLLGLLVAPRTAGATESKVSGGLEFETY